MKKDPNNGGYISVYLLLIFAVLLSLILLLIEGARKNAMCMKIECAMDLSLCSVFAEYNRELLKQYDLFFIDTSYGKEGASIDNTEEHIKGYLNDNFQISEAAGLVKDLLGLRAEEVTVTDFSLASDEKGILLKKQAVAYMKDLYGISYIEELKNQLATVETNELLTRDINGERNANQSIIDNYKIPPKKVSSDKWEEVKLNNPADAVNATRGVLTYVLPKDATLSNTGIKSENYISKRACNVGSGLSGRSGISLTDELVFNEYILKKTGNFVDEKENSELSYETEYILSGKENDVDNLKSIVNQLLLMREVANYEYLCQDATKSGEADALAILLTSVILCPQLKEPVKISLLFAWAYAESVYDVKSLLSGKKIPLLKSGETWHYSLGNMLAFAFDQAEDSLDTEDGGMSYSDYLRVFLALENSERKTERMMDVIEMDVRKTEGNSHFRLDTCVDYLEAEAFINSGYGGNYTILRHYYYEK